MPENVSAVVITFNPDIPRFEECLRAIAPQVGRVIVVDNGSSEVARILELADRIPRVECVLLPTNGGTSGGIAAALSALHEWEHYVLTLDQDSVAPAGMVRQLMGSMASQVGAVAPSWHDAARSSFSPDHRSDGSTNSVDWVITSGTLWSVAALREIGGPDRALFLSEVDYDMSFRLRRTGWRVIQDSSLVLDHQLGRTIPARLAGVWSQLGALFGLCWMGRLAYSREVKPARAYDAARALTYLHHKYRGERSPWTLRRLFRVCAANTVRSGTPLQVARATANGVRDGRAMGRAMNRRDSL